MYSGTPLKRPPLNKGQLQYNGQELRSQMCTKQPLNKGHPYNYNSQNVVPQGGRYIRVPLYHAVAR